MTRRWVTYTAAAVLLLVLGAIMVVQFAGYQDRQDQREAEQKAATLHAAFAEIGITAFDEETIARVLGSDGGGFCTDPAALVDATANLGSTNGAAGPGMRPSVLDERRLAGDRLVIETYCPDQLEAFDDYVDSLRLDDTTTQPGSQPAPEEAP
jgi:type II secretory pathway pseudopilin PulG